ncbi:MAG: PAS domain S-box protein [Anaerolineae bacterium]|nr:PAS domain S-box protein [Anaerolineae bacterium]
MDTIASLYVAALLLGFAAVLVLAVHSLQFRQFPGGRIFLLYVLSSAIMLMSFAMLAISREPSTAFFWSRLRFLGILTSSPLFLLFVLDYTGKTFRGQRVLAGMMFVIPALALFVLWSEQVVPLFFTAWSLTSYSFLSVERSQFGLWFQIHGLHSYALSIAAYYCLISSYGATKGAQRPAMLWILAGNVLAYGVAAIPGLIGNVLPLNIAPFGISAGLIITGWGLFRHRLFDVLAAAYHTVFLSFQDAVIVLNSQQEIVQWNPAADALLRKRVPTLMYERLDTVLALHGVRDRLPTAAEAEFEITMNGCDFNARLSTLRMSNGHAVGQVLVLRDITDVNASERTRLEAERLYRLLAENSTDMITLHTPAGQFVYMSPSSLNFTGYTEAELLARPPEQILSFVHPDDLPISMNYYVQVVMGKAESSVEVRLLKKDGTHFWAELRATTIHDAAGQLTHIMSVVRNVDERKRMEQALRDSNHRYDTLVTNIPAIVFQLRQLPQGDLLFDFISPNSVKYGGMSPTAIIADPSLVFRLVAPNSLMSLMAAHTEAYANLKPLVWEGEGAWIDGTWMHIEAIPSRLDDGTVVWNGVYLDITAQKQAELELERSRKMVEHIARTLPDVIHVVDLKDWTQVYSNQSLYKLLGYDDDEAAELTWSNHLEKLLHPEDYQTELTYGNRYATLRDDMVLETEYRWKHKTKGIVWLNVREVVYERDSEGRVQQVLGVIRDVTERKTAEHQNQQLLARLEAANQELKDFAYVISHDLRAPLRGVSSISHWLISRYGESFDSDGRELIELLGGRVRRMEQMINGVLEYSRIGRDKAAPSPVDLAVVVPQIVQDIVPTDRIPVIIEGDLPTVTVNPTRIRQVFQNLIDNAVKFMDQPQGEIRIGCQPDDGMWRFYVRDSGPGIPAEHFDRIFQLFQTLQSKDKLESTGVGLALTKRIVELYGGRIWVQSVETSGSTFFFTLPQEC